MNWVTLRHNHLNLQGCNRPLISRDSLTQLNQWLEKEIGVQG
jgi:hypothetical protein